MTSNFRFPTSFPKPDVYRKDQESFHPRENEYYEETNGEYLKKLFDFKKELEEQKTIRDKKREIKRRWYLKKKKIK